MSEILHQVSAEVNQDLKSQSDPTPTVPLRPIETKITVEDALWSMASAESDKFSAFFKRLRQAFPQKVALACIGYIAENGLDAAGQKMAYWLMIENKDLGILLDSEAVSEDAAKSVVRALSRWNFLFLARFVDEVKQISQPVRLQRALSLVPAVGDYTVLIYWLRALSSKSDGRIRSRAVKLMCDARPNISQIRRLLVCDRDARVRSNALEALWHVKIPEAIPILTLGLSDRHHRVVGSALVGLYLHGDASVMQRILVLCDSHQAPFRAAMAWCLGFILNKDGIPLLQKLSEDRSAMVRQRAKQSLLSLQSLVSNDENESVDVSEVSADTSSADQSEPARVGHYPLSERLWKVPGALRLKGK